MAEYDIEHPDWYNLHPSGVECITIAEGFSFNVGNAVKYIWRAGLKNDDAVEDLEKAVFYLKREIDLRNGVKPPPATGGRKPD